MTPSRTHIIRQRALASVSIAALSLASPMPELEVPRPIFTLSTRPGEEFYQVDKATAEAHPNGIKVNGNGRPVYGIPKE